jgi:hypothetical protein
VGRPSLKSYEDSIFAPYTFFAAILTLVASARALQSLINAGFAGIHATDTRSKRPVEKLDFARSGVRFGNLNSRGSSAGIEARRDVL